jgi:squalene-hopene/tetraprenyl-beta-curcumene cyclase
MSAQGLGVEAVLAALMLAVDASASGTLTAQASQALDRMWALQIREGRNRGAWPWFDLNLDPWETSDSVYFGAAMAAQAVGSAPAGYRARPEVRERLGALIDYLHRERTGQPLHNRLALVWAATRLPSALPKQTRKAIVAEALSKQQGDGGWTLESLGRWKPHPQAPDSSGSNAYATAFTAFVLREAGVSHSHPPLAKALAWLRLNQSRKLGHWSASSMNKHYPDGSMQARFMQDAATAFATLALLDAPE